jgi:hypothetical protein
MLTVVLCKLLVTGIDAVLFTEYLPIHLYLSDYTASHCYRRNAHTVRSAYTRLLL